MVNVNNVGNVSIHIAKDVKTIPELMQKENNVTGARVDKVLEISKTHSESESLGGRGRKETRKK